MDVMFVVMPFADVARPAIGVSLLKPAVGRLGFSSHVEYFNIRLAELIGLPLYNELANSFPTESLIGEWFFADAVFGEDIPHESDYISKILSRYTWQKEKIESILLARQHRDRFLEDCVDRIKELHPRVVGFTTTFHQSCACLALARRLKQLPNPPTIIFGGANCEGEMGLQMTRSFPWIDYVCSGEGDVTLPAFVESLLREGKAPPSHGLLTSAKDQQRTAPEPVGDLDLLPYPDYSDYFERTQASPLQGELRIDVLIETSRGCWWGAKQHCTFCGLNGDTMTFRSKSPQRVLDELGYLLRTYGVNRIECVDNILDLKYISTLFPALSRSGLNLEMFYEVKANLRYDQLAMLYAGGVRSIQPGIESFSNQVLRLMKKGCSGFQNIQLLRWCEEMGIQVGWNILSGFPGESATEYEHMAKLVPLLTHLAPPTGCSPVRLDRFSPFFTQADAFGLGRVRPAPAYYYVYPLGRRELARLAYFFDFDYPNEVHPFEYTLGLSREVNRWLELRALGPEQHPRLDVEWRQDRLVFTDTRPAATAGSHELRGLAAEIYLQCDVSQTVSGLKRQLANGPEEAEIRKELLRCLNARLMVEEEGHYLSLAVMRNRASIPRIEHLDDHIPLQATTDSQSLLHLV